jgi:hypothetical protein
MTASEFFKYIAERNYEQLTLNPGDLRSLWNAVISMNTVPEYVALERLEYREVARSELDKTAGDVRLNDSCLLDLKFCAEAFKHVRNIKDHRGRATAFTTTATSTGVVADDQNTWTIGSHDPLKVLREAYETLKGFVELK